MPRRDVSMSSEEIAIFLAEPHTGVLTTLDADGWPHSTGMWFLPEGELTMWTYAKSQKARNLQRDPRCTFLVESGTSYGELRGVMVRGRARLIGETDAVTAIGLGLFARYSGSADGDVPEVLKMEVERQASKRIGVAIPFERVASWDHRKL